MGFYEHPEYYDILFDWDRSAEIEFISKCLKAHEVSVGQDVLEIAAGTGLAAIPMAQLGWNVIALDYSQKMLDVLNEKSKKVGVHSLISLKLADMLKFSMTEKVNAAFCTIGSIGLLDKPEFLVDHLKALRENMNEGGIYVIDVALTDEKTHRTDYGEIIWSMERDGILVEAEGGKVYVNQPDCEELKFDWEMAPYEFNQKDFFDLIKESKSFKIMDCYPEKELTEDGVSVFDLAVKDESPTTRTMVVLKAL